MPACPSLQIELGDRAARNGTARDDHTAEVDVAAVELDVRGALASEVSDDLLDDGVGADDRDEIVGDQLELVLRDELHVASLDPTEGDRIPAFCLQFRERAESGVLDQRGPHDDLGSVRRRLLRAAPPHDQEDGQQRDRDADRIPERVAHEDLAGRCVEALVGNHSLQRLERCGQRRGVGEPARVRTRRCLGAEPHGETGCRDRARGGDHGDQDGDVRSDAATP